MNTDALASNLNLQQAVADLINKLPAAMRRTRQVQAVCARSRTCWSTSST